ncbi:hypothetical protein D3C81_1371020 [compost metagenome]
MRTVSRLPAPAPLCRALPRQWFGWPVQSGASSPLYPASAAQRLNSGAVREAASRWQALKGRRARARHRLAATRRYTGVTVRLPRLRNAAIPGEVAVNYRAGVQTHSGPRCAVQDGLHAGVKTAERRPERKTWPRHPARRLLHHRYAVANKTAARRVDWPASPKRRKHHSEGKGCRKYECQVLPVSLASKGASDFPAQ